MQVVPKKADDVMNVGMLEGFTVSYESFENPFFVPFWEGSEGSS